MNASTMNAATQATSQSLTSGYSALEFIALILESQRKGQTCFPYKLGLSNANVELLLTTCNYQPIKDQLRRQSDEEDTRQDLLEMRLDEWNDVRNLLLENRANISEYEVLLAEIVAAACMGGGHLWHDLGMPNRTGLSDLLNIFFTDLAARNVHDMKWKKFFYKQLCEKEGAYVCRAPTCGECAAYDDCFGPEE